MRSPPAATARPSDQQAARLVRVVLADSEPVFVGGLRHLCEGEGLVVTGSATSGEDAIRLVRQLQPDVAGIGVVMPDLTGLEVTRRIGEVSPGTRVLLLAALVDERRLGDAWQAGASGIALRSQPAAELVQAVREVAAGRRYVCSVEQSGVYRATKSGGAPGPLARREREVLQLIAEGNTLGQIAKLLGIAPKTAARHRERLRTKLGVHTTAHLVRWAIRLGLVVP